MKKLFPSISILTLLLLSHIAIAQSSDTGNTLKHLSPADYDQWERLSNINISENGEWINYSVIKNNGDASLILKNVPSESERIFKYANSALFSKDNKWICFKNGVSGKEAKKQRKSKKPSPSSITLIGLSTTDSLHYKGVRSFEFSNSGQFLAMRYSKPKEKESEGSDLVIKDLSNNKEVNFGNVSSYAWQDKGDLIALIIDADNKAGNGVQLYNAQNGIIKILDSKAAKYTGLNWREKSADLLFSQEKEDDNYEDNTYSIHVCKDLNTQNPKMLLIDQQNIQNFPEDFRITDPNAYSWSKNGNSIFFNIFPRPKTEEAITDSLVSDSSRLTNETVEEAADVEIWHSKDAMIITAQKMNAKKSSRQPYLSVFHLEDQSFVQLEDDLTERINFNDESPTMIGLDNSPYEFDGMFGRPKSDAYRINVVNGQKSKLTSGASYFFTVDETGTYVVYAKENQLFLKNLSTNSDINLSIELDESFFNIEDDHPVEFYRPYGFAGWSKDGKSFFINSKYDVWQWFIDESKGTNLTNGAIDGHIYRYYRMDRAEDKIDTSLPLYFSKRGEWTKKSGFSMLKKNKLSELIFEDAYISITKKVKNESSIYFTTQSFDQSPNVFVSMDNFETRKRLSNTNPFQSNYYWGKAELIEYKNDKGQKLQGILYYPADYEEGKKYPMITYIYEKLSQGLHYYTRPSKTNYYNSTVFAANGYFVLKPDILFEAGDPGLSSARILEIAVKKVVDMGVIDPERVGLVGHSWGGYQAAYVPTQTDIFAASVAGAGLTNLISMYGAITPAFGGTPENNHFEVSQERMITSPWKDVEGYVRNSPVMQIDKLNTPILFEVGTSDMNVNRRQGVEYYNAARRAGKQFVLLAYANEGHGLRQEKNQIDYQKRILTWFGHYLKGEPAEDWISDGIPYDEQQRRLKKMEKK